MTCTDGLSRRARQRGWLRLQMTDCQAKGRQRTCGALATATLVRPAREAEGHGDEHNEAGTPPRGARPLAFPGLVHFLKECAACLAGWGVPTLLPPSRRSEVSQGCDALPQEDGAIGGLLSWPVVESCGAVCKEGPRPGESHGHTHLAPGTRRSVLLRLWSARSSGPARPSWGDRSGPRFPGPRAARAECACACANAAPSPVQWARPLPCCPSHPRPRCCARSGSHMPAPNAIVQGCPPPRPPCPALCRPLMPASPVPSPHADP